MFLILTLNAALAIITLIAILTVITRSIRSPHTGRVRPSFSLISLPHISTGGRNAPMHQRTA